MRNAFDIVNDAFYKIADAEEFLAGTGVGLLGGTGIGIGAGTGLAKLTTRLTPEMKTLLKEQKATKKTLRGLENEYETNAFPTEDFMVKLKTNPNYGSLSVGDVDNLAKDYYSSNLKDIVRAVNNNYEKTAGLGSVGAGAALTGIPMAAFTGIQSFKNERNKRKDSNLAKATIATGQEKIKAMKDGTLSFDDFILNNRNNRAYSKENKSPYLYLNNGYDDERPYFASVLNDGLKEKGIDYKKMNFKEYDNMVENYINHYYRTGEEDPNSFLRYEYSRKL